MEFFRKTALAALVMGFSGAAFALPNITILATGERSLAAVIQQQNQIIRQVKLASKIWWMPFLN